MNLESYTVTIEELISEEFTVETETRDKAIRKAIELYKQGAFVLCPGSLEMRRIGLCDNSDEWIEF